MGFNAPRAQRVGNLRHKLTWQELVVIIDPQWGDTEEWVDRETEPCRVEPLKGSEQFASNETTARQAYRVFTRYRHLDNTADWRVQWWTGDVVEGEPVKITLDIVAATNPDERRRFLELLCDLPPNG